MQDILQERQTDLPKTAIATTQVAASTILTALTVPLLTTWVAKRNAAKKALLQQAQQVA
ncbi:hypothetical protein PY479_06725 [Shewanella sp. A32]|nr:hypothetical protein [Shewanella sp. A32]